MPGVLHAKPDLRVFLKWMIAGSGSVITDVITPKQMTETSISTQELNAFCDDIRGESDRAAVIIGAAKLDQMLHELIQQVLLPSSTGRDDLLDSDRGVGTFSARINLSHRLGLIDSEFAWAMHIIRRIRNTFAHQPATSTLDSGTERDRVRELVNVMKKFPLYNDVALPKFDDGTGTPSGEFRAALSVFYIRLESAAESFQRLDGSKAFFILPTA